MKYYILWVTPDGSHLWAGPCGREEISDVISHLAEEPRKILILPDREATQVVAEFDPQVGDVICDCRYLHLRVAARDGDELTLEDGARCSLAHCCDPPDHSWQHREAIASAPQLARLRTARQIHREEPLRIRVRAWLAWWLRDRWT